MSDSRAAKALVFGGKRGMLGQAVAELLADRGWEAVPLARDDVDPLDEDALANLLAREEPLWAVNAVAYTQVDQAEEDREAARLLNAVVPGILARQCARLGIRLAHFSTDFVFDGRSGEPYEATDEPHPSSIYGKTKLEGERAVADAGGHWLIIRTAWLFGPGKTNFVHKILSLARERDTLRVVHDQIGSPTYTKDLAQYTASLMKEDASGVFHAVNAGHASWCELAAEAVRMAGLACTVEAIASADYPQKAARPAYSVLSTSAFTRATNTKPRPWLEALSDYVFTDLSEELKA